jgi:hypothetical protein
MARMVDRWDTTYRGWHLSVWRGRPVVGCGNRKSPPYQVFLAKGFGGRTVLADLKRQIDEYEDGPSDRPASPAI